MNEWNNSDTNINISMVKTINISFHSNYEMEGTFPNSRKFSGWKAVTTRKTKSVASSSSTIIWPSPPSIEEITEDCEDMVEEEPVLLTLPDKLLVFRFNLGNTFPETKQQWEKLALMFKFSYGIYRKQNIAYQQRHQNIELNWPNNEFSSNTQNQQRLKGSGG